MADCLKSFLNDAQWASVKALEHINALNGIC